MIEEGTVLLVDDSADDCELLTRAFDEAGFPHGVVSLQDGQEALDYLFAEGRHAGRDRTEPPLLVVLDLKMPRVGGLEVLARLRQDGTLKHLPVIILTSSDEIRDRAEALKLGIGPDLYFSKPVDFDGYLGLAEDIKRLVSHIGAASFPGPRRKPASPQ